MPCTEAEVRQLIMMLPTKSCALDPIPTYLLKEFVDVLLPFVTAMINASLRESRLPPSQKHAVISPLLKKTRYRRRQVEELPSCIQPDVYVEAGGEGSGEAARWLPRRARSDAAAAVSI